MGNDIKECWNQWSDEYYCLNASENIISRIKKNPLWAFPPSVREMLFREFASFEGVRILVPSSGDNGAVFAFHLLGAKVTSADLAENQILNAKKIADSNQWAIEFVCTDSMQLSEINDEKFDLVYTSNGVHTWINDLTAMYRNFNRVLKPNGRYIMFETHPFIRPFDDSTSEIKLVKDYSNTANNDWRMMDFINAMLNQGLQVIHMEEFHSEPDSFDLWWYKTLEAAEADCNRMFDCTQNAWARLPQWIGVSARKAENCQSFNAI